jgi:hypothetical protein
LDAFHYVGAAFYERFVLDVGSIGLPTPGYIRFVGVWSVFGAVSSGLMALGIARLAWSANRAQGLSRRWEASPDWLWIAAGSLVGFAVPLTIRRFVLHNMPLTDDESVYRFAAQLLASGRLWAASPPMKIFFDHTFMINDGHLYPQYFLGWPALMAPGVWLGDTGLMNPIYAGLTVPPLFLVVRHLAGSSWAKASVVLYLASPMLMVCAATELSHTSCLMALAWMTWCFLRSRDAAAPWWSHAGVAGCFGVAFFVRPQVAVGIGLPMLVWWTLDRRAARGSRLAVSAAAFLIPAVLIGGLFLAANHAMNGSIWITSYGHCLAYMKENAYRFSGWSASTVGEPPLQWDQSLLQIPLFLGGALFRLNFDLFGWPCSLLFIAFAGLRGRGWLWLSLPTFILINLYLAPFDAGIDSFGPVHYLETAWPILLLTILGLRTLSERPATTAAHGGGRPRVPYQLLSPALLVALILTSFAGFVPVRFGTLARLVADIRTPYDALSRAGLHNAVIFSAFPFTGRCNSAPARPFVFWSPVNDPDLTNDVLWVNHISVEEDRRLMPYFAARRGYVMVQTKSCVVRFLPLEQLQPTDVPDAPRLLADPNSLTGTRGPSSVSKY